MSVEICTNNCTNCTVFRKILSEGVGVGCREGGWGVEAIRFCKFRTNLSSFINSNGHNVQIVIKYIYDYR